MKHTLILLFAISTIFASCHYCDPTCEQKLHYYDSLATNHSLQPKNTDVGYKTGLPPTVPDSFYIPYATADTYINLWNTKIQSINPPPGFAFSRSFILPLTNFQQLLNLQCQYVVMYLAIDTNSANSSADTISLVYIGGQVTRQNMLQLIPVAHVAGVPQAFDFTWPCPECSIAGQGIPKDPVIKFQYK